MPLPPNRRPRSSSFATAAVVVPLAIVFVVPLLAAVYAYAEIYIPFRGWVTVFLLGGFTLGLARSVDLAARLAKCRSVVFVRGMSAVAGVFGVYCSWVVFIYALLHKNSATDDYSLLSIFMSPSGMLHFAEDLANTGWFSISSLKPTGIELWILWALEAAIIVGVPPLLTGKFIRNSAWCDDCERWCLRDTALIQAGMPATTVERNLIESGDIATLISLPPKSKDLHEPRVRIELQSCPRCKETCAVQAFVLEHRKDARGKIKVTRSELLPLVIITREERDALRRAWIPPGKPAPSSGSAAMP